MDDMDNTAKFLCENIQGCKLAYVQSDEISLVLADFDDITTEAWFDGNVQKITSISAAMAAAQFNQRRWARDFSAEMARMHQQFLSGAGSAIAVEDIFQKKAFFDSRVFTIPDPVEVENYLIWRSQDATRNSIQMAAQSMFSHKELQGVNCNQLQEKMWAERQVNWNDYPEGFKRGRCVVKETYMAPIPNSKMERSDYHIPEVNRTRWVVEPAPIFTQDRDYVRKRLPRH